MKCTWHGPKDACICLTRLHKVILVELSKQLPLRHEVDHVIELVFEIKPLMMTLYLMALSKLKELRKQLVEMLERSILKLSKTPYGVLVLFQLKHDRSKWLCVNCKVLN